MTRLRILVVGWAVAYAGFWNFAFVTCDVHFGTQHMISFGILFGVYLVVFAATAVALKIGARWAGVPNVRFRWCFLTAFALALLNAFSFAVASQAVPPGLAAVAAQLVVTVFLSWFGVKLLFRTTWKRALRSWLPTLVPTGIAVGFLYLVLTPHILAAYIVPTHSMAPTLLGYHRVGVCPHCGLAATVTADGQNAFRFDDEALGMCGTCQQAGMVQRLGFPILSGDRIVVNKLLTPRRWDLIAYRPLHDPSQLHVKRLVGLSGEEVAIRDGSVWIDGIRVSPPSEVSKLKFTADLGFGPDAIEADAQTVRLKSDELFVLGDFAARSSDSRLWGPLPASHLEGVVDLIFWPFGRCRMIR